MVVVSLAWELELPASSAMSTIKITQVVPSSIACDKFPSRDSLRFGAATTNHDAQRTTPIKAHRF